MWIQDNLASWAQLIGQRGSHDSSWANCCLSSGNLEVWTLVTWQLLPELGGLSSSRCAEWLRLVVAILRREKSSICWVADGLLV